MLYISEYGGESTGPNGPQDTGKVYVFDIDGNHLRTLMAPEPEMHACFGASVSGSGDYVVVGEPFATVDDTFRAGKAYLYRSNGDHLRTFSSPVTKLNGRFGDCVSIDGDYIVIGEPFAHVNAGQYEGRAYIYNLEGVLLQNLTAVPPMPRAAFGLDLDIHGDMIVVGEGWAASGELGQVGRVHLYELGASVEVSEPESDPESGPESETEPESESNSGIPGFPLMSIIAVLVIYYLFREWMKFG